MQSCSLFDAKNRLSALVDAVEDGDTVTITRRGKAVARLVPVEAPEARGRNAAEKLRDLRDSIVERGVTVTPDEILAWRDEGRR